MERVLCIDDNADALVWRLRLIEEAEEKIVLSTFDFREDNSGFDIMSALFCAAERGVRIKILVDGFYGNHYLTKSSGFQALSAHKNVESKYYNPVQPASLSKISYRLHDKYIIVDEKMYMLGGRNTNDLFLGNYIAENKQNKDRDVLVLGKGESIHRLRWYFYETWSLSCCRPFTFKRNILPLKEEALRNHFHDLKEQFPKVFETVNWKKETIGVNRVELLTGDCRAVHKEPLLWKRLCDIMRQGKKILIETPYIMCDKEMYLDLEKLNTGGRRIRIFTNAVENGANPWGCVDYMNEKKRILHTGAGIYEYYGGKSLHTKAIFMDGHICMFGSYNLDMRSTYLDTETMLLIDSKELYRKTTAKVREELTYSKYITEKGEEHLGQNCRPFSMSFGKWLVYTILRGAILPIRPLL